MIDNLDHLNFVQLCEADIEEQDQLTQKMYLLLGECLMSLHHNPELQDKIAAVRKDVRGN